MKSKSFCILVSIALVLGLLIGGASCAKEETQTTQTAMAIKTTSAKPITLKMQSHMPIDHEIFLNIQHWGKTVTERSNGRVEFEYYPSNQLAAHANSLKALEQGIFEMLATSSSTFEGQNNISGYLWMPGIFPTHEVLANAWWNKGLNEIESGVYGKKNNTYPIYLGAIYGNTLLSTKPVLKLEDWTGLQITTTGAMRTEYLRLLGASPFNISFREQYIAIQRGIAEGAFIHLPALKIYGYYEIVDYVIESPALLPTSSLTVWINLDVWNSLPGDIQKIMQDAGKEQHYADIEWIKGTEDAAKVFAKEKGVELVNIPDDEYARWLAKLEPLRNDYVELCEKQGIGAEARKILEIADSYRINNLQK